MLSARFRKRSERPVSSDSNVSTGSISAAKTVRRLAPPRVPEMRDAINWTTGPRFDRAVPGVVADSQSS